MTDSEPLSATEATPGAGHADDHDAAGGHDDDHGAGHEHAEQPLGPIDVAAWGAGALGAAVGVAMVVAFALATGMLPV